MVAITKHGFKDKKWSDPPLFFVKMIHVRPVRYRLKKNVRVQILSKIQREGWVADQNSGIAFKDKDSGIVRTTFGHKANSYRYFFRSPDNMLAIEVELDTESPPHQVTFFKYVQVTSDYGLTKGYETIAAVSYKHYVRYGSEMILMENLM